MIRPMRNEDIRSLRVKRDVWPTIFEKTVGHDSTCPHMDKRDACPTDGHSGIVLLHIEAGSVSHKIAGGMRYSFL